MENHTATQRLQAAINHTGMRYDFDATSIIILGKGVKTSNQTLEGHVISTETETLFNIADENDQIVTLSIDHDQAKGKAIQDKMEARDIQIAFQNFFSRPINTKKEARRSEAPQLPKAS